MLHQCLVKYVTFQKTDSKRKDEKIFERKHNTFSIMKNILLFLTLGTLTACQEFSSPCPSVFKYEPRNPNEPDRWYGQATLTADSDLTGVWIRVIFDRASLQLGNWFGEVVTEDNKDYLIKNRTYKLKAFTPLLIRFFVKYDTREPPPQLLSFRLNAKTLCPEGVTTTEGPKLEGQLLTSGPLVTKPSRPSRPTTPPPSSEIFVRPGGGFNPSESTDEDDYFHGDFSYFNKPQKPVPETCGIVVKQPRPLITYGQQTEEGEFPWHAALYHARGTDLTYICGGSLISRYHLITVAHCVTRRKTQSTLLPSSLVVYLGKYYLKIWSNPGIQDRAVEKIIVHEKYNAQTFSYDLAILKLIQPAQITDFVRPVCLWEGPAPLETVVGKLGTVVGWGFDESGKVTEQLHKAQMPIVSQEKCVYSFPDFYSRFTSDRTFCAGFKNGTSVCNGDSGGGMVLPRPDSLPENPIWQLRGMVSISVALQNQFKCDATHYVVFTDVAKYQDWVKNGLNL